MDSYKIYGEIELTTDVMSASDHRLITLLFDKCMKRMQAAKKYITENNYEKKGEAIKNALEILQYLRNCLNHENEKSKDLSKLLESIYGYAQRNLIEANLHNSIKNIDEAEKVISDIQSGWDGIADKV